MVFHVVLASLTAHFSGSDHNYLSDLYQIMKVNGGVSASSRSLRYGVPRGSVLGPILFLLYSSPLGDIMRHQKVAFYLYANDT